MIYYLIKCKQIQILVINRYNYKYYFNFYNRYKYKYKCIYDTDFFALIDTVSANLPSSDYTI